MPAGSLGRLALMGLVDSVLRVEGLVLRFIKLIKRKGTDAMQTCKRLKLVNRSVINLCWKGSARELKLTSELIFAVRGKSAWDKSDYLLHNSLIGKEKYWSGWSKCLAFQSYRSHSHSDAKAHVLFMMLLSVRRLVDRLFKVQCSFLNYHSFPGFFLIFTSLNNQGDSVCERLVGWFSSARKCYKRYGSHKTIRW